MTAVVNTMKKVQMRRMVLTLFAFAILLAASYGYFVNETVMNVVALEKNEVAASETKSAIAELESEILALRQEMSLEYAHGLGFVEVKTTYAHVGPSGLTFNKTE